MGNNWDEKGLTGYPSIDKPWLRKYPHFLFDNRPHRSSIYDSLYQVWNNLSDVMINYYGNNITSKDFFDAVSIIVNSFTKLGIKEGDSILISLESVPEFIEILIACELLGIQVRSYIGSIDKIVDLLNKYSSQLYITHDYLSNNDMNNIYVNTAIEHIITINPLASVRNLSDVRSNIIESINEHYSSQRVSDTRNITWKQFLSFGSYEIITPLNANKKFSFSAFTSGTTGTPKEVIHNSKSILGIVDQLSFAPINKSVKDTWLLTIVPPTLVATVVATMLYPLIDGKTLILDPFCKIEDLDIEMMYYEPNCWALVPCFFETLIKSKRIPSNYNMSYFKLFGFGAEPISKKFALEIQLFLDSHNCTAPFSSGYGQSEGGSDFTVCIERNMILEGSAGIPLIDTIISIFASNSQNELCYNEIGEICKSGPGLMIGYEDNESTAQVLQKHSDGKLWLHTGDYGFMNEEGYLFVLGRKIINIFPNHIVFPSTIENKILTINGISEAIIVSGEDYLHKGFELLYLFVIPDKSIPTNKLIKHINECILQLLPLEEKFEKIYIIDKKPIKKFKTDIEFLQNIIKDTQREKLTKVLP